MLNPYIDEFIAIAIVNLLALMLPGPDFAVVVKNSIGRSRSHGIITSIGVSLGVGFHVLYTLLGISVLIHSMPNLFFIIKLLGASYLAYLGIKSLISGKKRESLGKDFSFVSSEQSLGRSLIEGLLTNIFNPKCTIFFLCLLSGTIDLNTPNLILGLIAVEILGLTFLWFSFLACFITLSFFQKRLETFFPKIEKIMGVFLLALATYIVFFEKLP
jgi:threonine/homoserine/homoserine lactone efflux protein